MAGMTDAFKAHLESGRTTLCRAWAVTRTDGVVLGFTDHDCPLTFDGISFKPDSGLTAKALQQGTGLAVDNTEAMGVLSDAVIREQDIDAGRFDGAEVRAWLVNWADPDVRWLQFRGSLGEIRRAGGAFHAELRGLTEMLNTPQGRVYQKPCTAVLGDSACRFDLAQPGYRAELAAETVEEQREFRWGALQGYEPGWFRRGRLTVLSGAAEGLWGVIKQDRSVSEARVIELWEPLGLEIAPGDMIRLDPGCDKRPETCRLKFANLINFQGFPDIPGEDWMLAVPRSTNANTGGSRR
jgi:uncharacterized phage protein (TIGR02218 family)